MTQVLRANESHSSFSYYYHDKNSHSPGRKATCEQHTVIKPNKLSPEKRRYNYRLHRNDSGNYEEESFEEEEIRMENGSFEGWQERMHKKNNDKTQPQQAKQHDIRKSEHPRQTTDKKRKPISTNLQDALQRRLSNSLPLSESSPSTTDKDKRSRRSKPFPLARQKVKSKRPTLTGEGNNSNPSNNQLTHKDKVAHPKKTTTGDNDKSNDSSSIDVDPPTNVDETGKDAKLLAVRRIGSPSDKDQSRESNPNNDGEDSTSSSIQDGAGEAPDVFLPKRYILAIMMFMGFVNMYAVRVNLNVAIGAMANNHTVVRNGVAITVVSLIHFKLKNCFISTCCFGE